MDKQLVLALPHEPALDAENFHVSACNEAAARLIGAWPQWPGRACVIVGPQGSGKSHLAQIWCERAGAVRIGADALSGNAVRARHIAIEDVERAALDERAFFHLLNLSKEQGFDILLTARTPPGEWDVALPDLRSRFRSLSVVHIQPPDDDLLRALLLKHFADRQLQVPPEVVAYLVRRMERSAAEAEALVSEIDRAALSHRRGVSKSLVRAVMASLPRYAGLAEQPGQG